MAQLEVRIMRSGRSRLHDLLWRVVFEQIAALAAASNTGANTDEQRLYGCMHRSALILGEAWPSDLRNLVNYAPGKGYLAVRREQTVDGFGIIRGGLPSDFNTALNRFEENVSALSRADGVTGNAPNSGLRPGRLVVFARVDEHYIFVPRPVLVF